MYFWTPHHERSPQLVLVRLARIGADEMAELLEESYRLGRGRGTWPAGVGRFP